MLRTAWKLIPAVAALSLVVLVAGSVKADPVFMSPPAVPYYYPAPTVTYYSPPVVYPAAPSYYYGPPVSYYTPSPSYYAAPAGVTTTRYGWFGWPRVTTYYPPGYVGR